MNCSRKSGIKYQFTFSCNSLILVYDPFHNSILHLTLYSQNWLEKQVCNKYNIPENIDLTEIGAYAQKKGHSEMAV